MESTQHRRAPVSADMQSSHAPAAASAPEPGKHMYSNNNALAVSLLAPLAILLAFGGTLSIKYDNTFL